MGVRGCCGDCADLRRPGRPRRPRSADGMRTARAGAEQFGMARDLGHSKGWERPGNDSRMSRDKA